MGWKNFPTWLKGGIIVGLFSLIVDVIYFIILNVFGESSYSVLFFLNNKDAIILSGKFFPWFMGVFNLTMLPAIIQTLYSLIIYFVIGAFIGWIIGKIKYKKQK